MLLAAAAALAAFAHSFALAQPPCRGSALDGLVRDSTLALVPGAALTLDGTATQTSASDGHFRFACVTNGTHHLSVSAEVFAKNDLSLTAPNAAPVSVVLQLAAVQTEVNVSGTDQAASTSPTASGPTQTISGSRLQSLADDPDDLLQELQQLAAAAGGSPSGATIAVDGFDSGEGATHLPPKSSIAYDDEIRVKGADDGGEASPLLQGGFDAALGGLVGVGVGEGDAGFGIDHDRHGARFENVAGDDGLVVFG